MPPREELLNHLWVELIDQTLEGNWIENSVRAAKDDPTAPFSDVGPAVERLLALGASEDDLNIICRAATYEGVFGALYWSDYYLRDDNLGLYEELLMADPSGREGRPKLP